ncbi:MAG: phosphodiester glycosidase family protein [Scytonema sp. PMC 1069.18]|nr:phosphodiester glycosidase family protein [Scytonema sp. PMC 1069.18]MEC4884101.1 phosphodiester glycosidase family protein [Scytonema sp. PMC 1070.18]
MRKIYLFLGAVISLGILISLTQPSLQHSIIVKALMPKKTSLLEKSIQYEKLTLAQSEAHILVVPSQSQFSITPALSPKLNTIEEFQKQYQAIAIINGGFFDPNNQKTTSVVILNGKLIADPRKNERLINNPDLKPYLANILNRSEFRSYVCGLNILHDIVLHNNPIPKGCQLRNAMGGGPQLLPELTSEKEGFVDKTKHRDALGSTRPNARTAIGITRDGSVILVMVAQKTKAHTDSGISLPALADFMKSLGATKAMNLDGGSSSSLYYNGKSFYGKVDSEGNFIKRPVKSVLLVQ